MHRSDDAQQAYGEIPVFTVRYFTPSHKNSPKLKCDNCFESTSQGFIITWVTVSEVDGEFEPHDCTLCPGCFAGGVEPKLNRIIAVAEACAEDASESEKNEYGL